MDLFFDGRRSPPGPFQTYSSMTSTPIGFSSTVTLCFCHSLSRHYLTSTLVGVLSRVPLDHPGVLTRRIKLGFLHRHRREPLVLGNVKEPGSLVFIYRNDEVVGLSLPSS